MAYDILTSFSDLTNPPVQYSIYMENRLYWIRRRQDEGLWGKQKRSIHLSKCFRMVFQAKNTNSPGQ